MPPISKVLSVLVPNWRNGSAPAYGAGGCGFEPHVGLGIGSRSSVGRSSASHAEGPGFDPLRELVECYFRGRSSVQSAQRTGFPLRYGVVGNMSGSHPVASGSIPGIGLHFGSLSSVGRASA